MIGKIEKAKRYAEEPDRFQFDEFSITFRGDNNNHQIRFDQGKWQCDCDFFHLRGVCCHSMALERILEHMLTVPSPV
ncbi:MAG TPA: hypothetical protein VII90_02115 [Anaerolineales bacterium]